jgi:hypothetical protein
MVAVTMLVGLVARLFSAAALPVVPVVIDKIVAGPESRVTLTNKSTQPATAWSLAASWPSGEGRTHREVQTVDGYLSEVTKGLPGASPFFDRLLPGESRELPHDPLPPNAAVDVIAVVLDDGTAIGDEEVIRSIFERRAQERDALDSVVAAFGDVLAALHGTAALDALAERLDTVVQHAPSIPCRAARDAVETYRQRRESLTTEQIDQSLRTYAAFVTRERDLAAKHAQRKNG